METDSEEEEGEEEMTNHISLSVLSESERADMDKAYNEWVNHIEQEERLQAIKQAHKIDAALLEEQIKVEAEQQAFMRGFERI